MLFNEPKLLKFEYRRGVADAERRGFSALQRAEIAEIRHDRQLRQQRLRFSALQRAEIAEILRRVIASVTTSMFQCSSTSRNC